MRRRKQNRMWHGTESNAMIPLKKAIWRCQCTTSPGWEGAGGHAILVLNQKQVPQGLPGQPGWLVWRGRWLNVIVFYVLDLFLLNCFGSFFMFFFICGAHFALDYGTLNKIAFWIISFKLAYWIISIKLAYWIISIKNCVFE